MSEEEEDARGRSNTWREELASLMEETGIIGYPPPSPPYAAAASSSSPSNGGGGGGGGGGSESFKDQVKGFAEAWGEMVVEFGRGCRDVVQQSIVTQDSFIARKLRPPCHMLSAKLEALNEFLPEDRDPAHSWSVIFFVFIIAFSVLSANNSSYDISAPPIKIMYKHLPSATRVQLPDGRYLSYHELGVSADRARFSVIAVHSFLSSRLAGLPGVKVDLLEAFGVRFITYDLPGFGESDPHPKRDLNSSAFDILHLANAVGVTDKFWVWGFSNGAMHVLAALRYIPERVAGVALFAPMVNPYDTTMTKEEMSRIWEKLSFRRRFLYFLARRFPRYLTSSYGRSFLSGKHGEFDKYLSLSLGRKDKALISELVFEEFWHRDVEESVRQGNAKPFVEEAVLQVSNWGFSLNDLQVQKKCQIDGILPWLKSIYSTVECELTGYQGPMHIWQGVDDLVIPPSMTDYIVRVLPAAVLHKLPNEGHFSYFFFCDKCHKEIFSSLFGIPQGSIKSVTVVEPTRKYEDRDEVCPLADTVTA